MLLLAGWDVSISKSWHYQKLFTSQHTECAFHSDTDSPSVQFKYRHSLHLQPLFKWFKWKSNYSQRVHYFNEANKQPVEPKDLWFFMPQKFSNRRFMQKMISSTVLPLQKGGNISSSFNKILKHLTFDKHTKRCS